jgi:ribosomal protein L28
VKEKMAERKYKRVYDPKTKNVKLMVYDENKKLWVSSVGNRMNDYPLGLASAENETTK